jgi:hypothetical protein
MVMISMGRLPLRMGVLTESESVTARKVEEGRRLKYGWPSSLVVESSGSQVARYLVHQN